MDYRDDLHDEIYYRKYVPGAGWQTEEEASIYWPASEPAIAVDGLGRVHLVWWDHNGGLGRLWYRMRDPAAGWDSVQVDVGDPSRDEYAPSIAADSEGTVHIVHTRSRVLGPEIRYVSKNAAGVWQSGSIISSGDGTESRYPSIFVDGDDNLHVAWVGGDGPPHDIFYIKHTDGVGWDAAPTKLNDSGADAGEPCIAVDGSGGIHVVWEELHTPGEEVVYRGFTPGLGWDASSVTISPYDSVYSLAPSVTAGPSGEAHVVWHDYLPAASVDEVFYRCLSPDSGWSAVERLTDTPGGRSLNADIAVDPCGQMAVLFENAADGRVYLTRWVGGAASIDPGPDGTASGLRLRAHPNPFRHAAEIRVIVPDGGTIAGPEVGVFDIRGSLVAPLTGRRLSACEHRFSWQGTDSRGMKVASGVYFIRASCGDRGATRSIVVLR